MQAPLLLKFLLVNPCDEFPSLLQILMHQLFLTITWSREISKYRRGTQSADRREDDAGSSTYVEELGFEPRSVQHKCLLACLCLVPYSHTSPNSLNKHPREGIS